MRLTINKFVTNILTFGDEVSFCSEIIFLVTNFFRLTRILVMKLVVLDN